MSIAGARSGQNAEIEKRANGEDKIRGKRERQREVKSSFEFLREQQSLHRCVE
jgi:hypothetical protein